MAVAGPYVPHPPGTLPALGAPPLVFAAVAAGLPGDWCVALAVAGAVAARRALSRFSAAYLAMVVLCLVLAGRLAPAHDVLLPNTKVIDGGRADTCAALWIAAVVLAAGLGLRHRSTTGPGPTPAASLRMALGAMAVSAVGLAFEVLLIAAGSVGVASQVSGGGSGGGYVGLFGALGPVLAAAAVVVLHRTEAPPAATVAATGLFGLHLLTLPFTGFRGAAPVMCLAVVIAAGHRAIPAGSGPPGPAAVDRPASPARSRRDRRPLARRPARHPAPLVLLGAAGVALFLLGSSVRATISAEHGQHGPAQVSLGQTPETIIRRLDYRPYLLRALDQRHDPDARQAVALSDQAASAAPRFLYPNKPPVDYGHAVSYAVFELPRDVPTFSTITAFGDAVLNLGLGGATLLICGWVLALDACYRRCAATTVPMVAIRILLIQVALDVGTPPVLATVTLVRSVAMLGVVLVAIRVATDLLPRRSPRHPTVARLGRSAPRSRPTTGRQRPT
ncbi:hypothetical protein [Frankia gtarii]|uniref:hypothetical protein n=1 Tax=Frankia gtarii TaxID=2950102 RepID=UPI0021C20EC9|nr:hypothetical protein [Frankia gtarii]